MAGGKETPRQKMIGMMYLVLTALLALNVSKSILDAFVAIEENTQKGNIAQVQRGNGYVITVRSEKGALEATDAKGNAPKIKNIDEALKQMDKINEATAKMIVMIDNIKIDILKKSGENVSSYKDNDELTILADADASARSAATNDLSLQYLLGMVNKVDGKQGDNDES